MAGNDERDDDRPLPVFSGVPLADQRPKKPLPGALPHTTLPVKEERDNGGCVGVAGGCIGCVVGLIALFVLVRLIHFFWYM